MGDLLHRRSHLGIAIAVLAAILAGVVTAMWTAHSNAVNSPQLVSIGRPAQAGAQTNLANFNPAMIYEARIDSVVTIEASFGASAGDGTGFVVDNDGHIATASHVIYDYRDGTGVAKSMYIVLASGERVDAKLVGFDQYSDIAILKVDTSKVDLKPVPWGNSDKVIPGEPVAVIGAPFGNGDSISTGIVSNARRTVPSLLPTKSNIVDAIQTDAPINKGNSGGPVFDARGRIIGMAQQIQSESGATEGVGFLVPVNTVKRVYEQIAATGKAEYARIGIDAETVTPLLAKQFGLPRESGALVAAVDGPAAAAGISAGTRQAVFAGKTVRLGDLVTSIAGSQVTGGDDILRIMSRLDVGARVEIVYYRDGQRYKTTAVTTARA